MARIRSQHPGQWTDEDFVQCSPYARLLALAIRNEADDQGVFEWKPVTIKMRLFPADDVDIEALLAELIAFNQIKEYEHGGRKYGVIRNFVRYQRPKKPNPVYFLPADFRTYAGYENGSSEPVRNQAGNDTELPSQKKEEGGNKEVSCSIGMEPKAKRNSYPEDFEAFWKEFPTRPTDTKALAFKAWSKAIKVQPPADLTAAAKRYARFCADKSHEAMLVPTWVNREGWTADLGASSKPAPQNPNDWYS